MRSIKPIFIALLTALLLCSCNATPTPAETTAPVETTAPIPAVEPIVLASGGKSDYTVLRADESTDTVIELATAVWKRFETDFGTRVSISTDWVKRGEEPPADAPEILIGPTNRPISETLAASIEGGGYRVKVEGARIVVAASADWMLEPAIDALFEAAVQDATGRWVVPGDLDLCGDLSAFARPGWNLDALPAYDGGELSEAAFAEPLSFAQWKTASRMLVVRNTLRREFDAYLTKAEEAGFAVSTVTDGNGIIARRLEKGEIRAYVYFTEGTNEARFILEQGDDTPLSEFSYTYTPKAGEKTTVYQFGLMMDKDGVDFAYNGNTRLNCGHMYFIHLADNSILVIDGGGVQQMSDSTATELLRLFREITGAKEGEKIRIAGWFISHRHPDHYNGFARFVSKHHSALDIERIFYNIAETSGEINKIRSLLQQHYPDILYHKTHTGETISLGGADFDVIYTLEDQVSASTGAIASTDFNDTSTVLRIRFDGASLLLLGDASGGAEKELMRMYGTSHRDTLKVDILQVAHHGWNNLSNLYNLAKPAIALYPQSSGGAQRGLGGNAANVLARVKAVSGEIYYAGDETVGVAMVDGKPTVVYRAAVVGEEYRGWDW